MPGRSKRHSVGGAASSGTEEAGALFFFFDGLLTTTAAPSHPFCLPPASLSTALRLRDVFGAEDGGLLAFPPVSTVVSVTVVEASEVRKENNECSVFMVMVIGLLLSLPRVEGGLTREPLLDASEAGRIFGLLGTDGEIPSPVEMKEKRDWSCRVTGGPAA